MNPLAYKTKSLDHLGLVAALCQELGIARFIDEQIPNQSEMRHISYGQLVVSMILNGLGFVSRTLHLFPDYFADKPLERLLGAGIKATHINDDALGRCLDKLYELGVSGLYESLAEKVIVHLGLPCHLLHLDSTSFHVDGEYASNIDGKSIRLTKGYSRDHRPDLNQVILNLITENQAGIPLYMQACSGNANDSESFKKLVKSHIGSLKAAQRSRYFIGDSSLYTAETIQYLEQEKKHFITRVPQKINEAKSVLKRCKGLAFSPLGNGYSAAWFDSDYAGVKQKWLLVKSEQAGKRENQALNKTLLKNTEASVKSFKKLCQQSFACEIDAKAGLKKWEQEQDYVQVCDATIVSTTVHAARGRPKLNAQVTVSYQISGCLNTCLARKEVTANEKGLFILATNDCSGNLSMDLMLEYYKSQQTVERGFRFLKSPDFLVSSLFLKKPERIEALLMIMTCCLMIYATLEHLIRKQLVSKGLFFPDMKKKPTQKPTARWVFFCFQGIHELVIENKTKIIVNLKERQKIILHCLGDPYWKIYS